MTTKTNDKTTPKRYKITRHTNNNKNTQNEYKETKNYQKRHNTTKRCD